VLSKKKQWFIFGVYLITIGIYFKIHGYSFGEYEFFDEDSVFQKIKK